MINQAKKFFDIILNTKKLKDKKAHPCLAIYLLRPRIKETKNPSWD
jgi:hypothetical protein